MNKSEFWGRVKAHIKEQKTTQKAVAFACGMKLNTLNRQIYDDTMPDAEKLVKIARFLGTTVEYLVTGEIAVNSYKISQRALETAKNYDNLTEKQQYLVDNTIKEFLKEEAVKGREGSHPRATRGGKSA
jgi:transcriptional regulator with XRE-family HTH domain